MQYNFLFKRQYYLSSYYFLGTFFQEILKVTELRSIDVQTVRILFK